MDNRQKTFITKLLQYGGKKNVLIIAKESGYDESESKTIVPFMLNELATTVVMKAKFMNEALALSSDKLGLTLANELAKMKHAMDQLDANSDSYIDLNRAYNATHDKYVKHTGIDKREKTVEKEIDISKLTLIEQEQFLKIMDKLNG
jgi:cobyrinic acid a,c-diamide synthase